MKMEPLDKLEQISLWRPADMIDIQNPTEFEMIGSGQQGAVFKIDQHRCVKVYYSPVSLERELQALRLGGQAGICPEVYFWGDKYLVMEFIDSPSLYDYLQHYPMTKDLAKKVVDLLNTFEAVGFNRYDHSLRHIFLLPDESLKVIDVVHVIRKKPVNFARKLISEMGVHAEDFIDYVKEISPKWYLRWVNHPDFAETMEKAKMKE